MTLGGIFAGMVVLAAIIGFIILATPGRRRTAVAPATTPSPTPSTPAGPRLPRIRWWGIGLAFLILAGAVVIAAFPNEISTWLESPQIPLGWGLTIGFALSAIGAILSTNSKLVGRIFMGVGAIVIVLTFVFSGTGRYARDRFDEFEQELAEASGPVVDPLTGARIYQAGSVISNMAIGDRQLVQLLGPVTVLPPCGGLFWMDAESPREVLLEENPPSYTQYKLVPQPGYTSPYAFVIEIRRGQPMDCDE